VSWFFTLDLVVFVVEAMSNEGTIASEQHRNDKQTTTTTFKDAALNVNRHSRMKKQILTGTVLTFNITIHSHFRHQKCSLPTPHLSNGGASQRLMGKLSKIPHFSADFCCQHWKSILTCSVKGKLAFLNFIEVCNTSKNCAMS